MLDFLKAACGNLLQTGSFVESSTRLANRMTKVIDFTQPINIVELGAGTGSITRHLLSKMNTSATLTSFEINPRLYEKLQRLEHRKFTAVNDDVSLMRQYITRNTADYVISGLPLANLGSAAKELILEAAKAILKPGGFFIQFQYSLADLSLLRKKFPHLRLGFEIINMPPAFIYYAQKR